MKLCNKKILTKKVKTSQKEETFVNIFFRNENKQ